LSKDGIKPATQKRSQQTRDRLVEALEICLRDKPFDQISVAEIAAKANVSVGAVYRRFENKDAFIPVIFEIYRTRLVAFNSSPDSRAEIDPEAGLLAGLRTVARVAWVFLVAQAHIVRAAHIYGRLRPDLVGEGWTEMLEQSVAAMEAGLEVFKDEIKRPINRETAEIVSYVFNSIFVEKGLYPEDGPGLVVSLEGEAFAQEMADLIYAYLVTPKHP
jgi:AcrR family transcriptional regulator